MMNFKWSYIWRNTNERGRKSAEIWSEQKPDEFCNSNEMGRKYDEILGEHKS